MQLYIQRLQTVFLTKKTDLLPDITCSKTSIVHVRHQVCDKHFVAIIELLLKNIFVLLNWNLYIQIMQQHQCSLWVSSVCTSISKPRASCTSEWVWPCVTVDTPTAWRLHQTHHHTKRWSQKINILTKPLWAVCVCTCTHSSTSILYSIHQFNAWSY